MIAHWDKTKKYNKKKYRKLKTKIKLSFERTFRLVDGYTYKTLILVDNVSDVPGNENAPSNGVMQIQPDFEYSKLTVYVVMSRIEKNIDATTLDLYFTHEMVHAIIDIARYVEENAVMQLTQLITRQDSMTFL